MSKPKNPMTKSLALANLIALSISLRGSKNDNTGSQEISFEDREDFLKPFTESEQNFFKENQGQINEFLNGIDSAFNAQPDLSLVNKLIGYEETPQNAGAEKPSLKLEKNETVNEEAAAIEDGAVSEGFKKYFYQRLFLAALGNNPNETNRVGLPDQFGAESTNNFFVENNKSATLENLRGAFREKNDEEVNIYENFFSNNADSAKNITANFLDLSYQKLQQSLAQKTEIAQGNIDDIPLKDYLELVEFIINKGDYIAYQKDENPEDKKYLPNLGKNDDGSDPEAPEGYYSQATQPSDHRKFRPTEINLQNSRPEGQSEADAAAPDEYQSLDKSDRIFNALAGTGDGQIALQMIRKFKESGKNRSHETILEELKEDWKSNQNGYSDDEKIREGLVKEIAEIDEEVGKKIKGFVETNIVKKREEDANQFLGKKIKQHGKGDWVEIPAEEQLTTLFAAKNFLEQSSEPLKDINPRKDISSDEENLKTFLYDISGPLPNSLIFNKENKKKGDKVWLNQYGLVVNEYESGMDGLSKFSNQLHISDEEFPEKGSKFAVSAVTNFPFEQNKKDTLYCIATASKEGVVKHFVNEEIFQEEIVEKQKTIFEENLRRVKMIDALDEYRGLLRFLEDEIIKEIGKDRDDTIGAEDLSQGLDAKRKAVDQLARKRKKLDNHIEKITGDKEERYVPQKYSDLNYEEDLVKLGILKKDNSKMELTFPSFEGDTNEILKKFFDKKIEKEVQRKDQAPQTILEEINEKINDLEKATEEQIKKAQKNAALEFAFTINAENDKSVWNKNLSFELRKEDAQKLKDEYQKKEPVLKKIFSTSESRNKTIDDLLSTPIPSFPYKGISIHEPRGKNMATVVFNGLDGHDTAYIHLPGTNECYRKVKRAKEDCDLTIWKNGKPETIKAKAGEIIIEDAIFVRKPNGGYQDVPCGNIKELSKIMGSESQAKKAKHVSDNFLIKAMSVDNKGALAFTSVHAKNIHATLPSSAIPFFREETQERKTINSRKIFEKESDLKEAIRNTVDSFVAALPGEKNTSAQEVTIKEGEILDKKNLPLATEEKPSKHPRPASAKLLGEMNKERERERADTARAA